MGNSIFHSPTGFSHMSVEQEVSTLLQSHQPTVTVPLRSEELTPDTWVTLPQSAELLRVSVVTTPETLVVTPVEAVAGLPCQTGTGLSGRERSPASLPTHLGGLLQDHHLVHDSQTMYKVTRLHPHVPQRWQSPLQRNRPAWCWCSEWRIQQMICPRPWP